MKAFYPVVVIAISLAFISFSKDKSEHKDEYKTICFKGRYVGSGCADVIQIISPSGNKRLKASPGL